MTDTTIHATLSGRLHHLIDQTDDDVDVTNCVPRCGVLRTTPDGYYFDHVDGTTYYWSAAAWQQVGIEEATSWGILVPDKPQPWITLVRHEYAAIMRRQISANHDASRLTPLIPRPTDRSTSCY